MNNRVMLAALVIWNWTTGQEIMASSLYELEQTRLFDFLSDDTLVICRRFDPTETLAQSLPENTFGLLDIYKFDPLATSPATLVTSLALPANVIKGETDIPLVFFSSSLYTPSLQPQIWEISPETRLLCISIRGKYDWENVCVQAHTLLEYAGTTNNSIVRWEEWGSQAVWDKCDGPISRLSCSIRTHGRRLFTMSHLYLTQEIEIYFFELESEQDGRIVPALRGEFAMGPKPSKQTENEVPVVGPRSEFEMNDESIMVFRETFAARPIRDLELWTL
ncbi:hypothetical protein FRC12_005831 [Ceratobasidium sp. 428]|nr:hypothetical protein FRC12_005831 [Ceratobasidium sp. 428]